SSDLEYDKSSSLSSLAQTAAEMEQTSLAVELLTNAQKAANSIENDLYRARSLSSLAQTAAEMEQTSLAVELLTNAQKAANSIEYDLGRAMSLSSLAQTAAEMARDSIILVQNEHQRISSDFIGIAEAVALKMDDSQEKAKALETIISVCGELEIWKRALTNVERMPYNYQLLGYATFLEERGNMKRRKEMNRKSK
ncbi:MAG: hypothetical protein AAGC85_05305, partial [Bacteroidota bacterium]